MKQISHRPLVAFLCVHNSCRSQMAEALAKHLAADVFDSCSAGTAAAGHLNPDAVRLIQQCYGIDMTRTQYSKTLQDIPTPDVVVLMGCGATCPTLPAQWVEDWGLDDPTGQPDAVFLSTIQQIETKILDLKERLRAAFGQEEPAP